MLNVRGRPALFKGDRLIVLQFVAPKSLEVSEPSEVKKSYGAIQQELINMANKDKANDFKKPSNYECVDFVSRVDNQRSIPNVLAKKQAYHHGDVNLRDAIIAMAHDFVGSNNMARIVCLLMDMRKVGVPNYNPRDIVNNLKRLINNEDSIPMHPWYPRKQLQIHTRSNDKIHQVNNTSIRYTELPIRVRTQIYKEQLELWISGTHKGYEEDHSTTTETLRSSCHK
ncbi:2378_t:CDS:2 [Funneliformis geosporum]|uniref:DNA topoisomerase (ATP-hydrolyzing) n=1 Tax=Funneliformis geosporum TaxID=1117311 RepID=A0A9W4WSE8_9GLOM|nr:2378_t:CDS:2 [Funneliformis geosporum]